MKYFKEISGNKSHMVKKNPKKWKKNSGMRYIITKILYVNIYIYSVCWFN